MVNKDLNLMPEIFIGIVSFVGIDTKPVIKSLERNFKRSQYRYESVIVKISEAFPQFDKDFKLNILDGITRKDRIEKYIDFGNKMRERFGNDFWAQHSVNEVREKRKNSGNKDSYKVYIIDQLKTEAELALLKSVYGKAFFQISIHSARDKRVDYLAKYKAQKENTRNELPYRSEAENLVNQDYEEKQVSHGQRAGKIFQLADIIINVDDTEEHPIETQISRFVELLFGSNKYSPSHMEYGMYQAHSASLRSLDLSRQVGAAIFRCTGEIAALGCNEVPKAGGGTYWTDGKYDAREYKKGGDSNDGRKQELLNELESILLSGASDKEQKILYEVIKKKENELNNSQFMDALEYGRIVHAEMNAITDAARHGIPLKKAILYCTTFPCHMCAKHIIAAGLEQVVFLESYPKSLTSDMHPDSVQIEGTSRGRYESYPFVKFSHFFGITANRYAEIFQRGKRKDKDGFRDYNKGQPMPIFSPYETDRKVENIVAKKFIEYFATQDDSANSHKAEPVNDTIKNN